ncbi:MAG: bifunctional 4-hydroxy-2-oxoglutarate aldolase/2-dehydro-3-deoxy-phosphogluconate aldolase [Lachnospiraceae bacterium]|nr:bifunctional 4-hydroxy-2-oxoglutarate aldolase/2-dehydro-3-deoxy-phosphogluconate aldolase [Lachnospiraceae bacterium]
MKEQVIQNVLDKKIIAIIRGMDPEVCVKLAEAFYAGGIDMIEVTFNQAKPEEFYKTADAIRAIREKFAGKVMVGAGTVITMEQLKMAADAGAQYIISPSVDVEIIKKTVEMGLVSMPGAMTPSEIVTAYQAGASFVKVFPIGDLGASYLKALKAPLSHIPLLAVGGVNPDNVADFIKAGAVGAGVGGNLTNKAWIAAGEYDKITEVAAALVKNARG